MPIAATAPVTTGLWAGTHHGLETAGYLAVGLISLALMPTLFIATDHAVVVDWSNAILDLISLK